jgi:hypothetical protein
VKNKKQIEWYYFIPILFSICIVPLIVYDAHIQVNKSIQNLFMYKEGTIDFFSFYKGIWIILASIVSLISLYLCYKSNKLVIRKSNILVPISIYTFFILLSTIFSEFKDIAVWGFYDRYEGAFVLISYIVLFFVAFNLITEEKHLKIVLGSLFLSAIVICLLCIFQYWGYDFYKSLLGKELISSSKDIISFTYLDDSYNAYKNYLYGSIGNPNYAGSYIVMLFTLSIVFFLTSEKKSHKILLGLLSCVFFSTLIGSNSRGSYIATIFSVVFIVLFLRKYIMKNYRSVFGITLFFIIIFNIFNYESEEYLSIRFKALLNGKEPQQQSNVIDKIKDFKINNNQLNLITTSNSQLFVRIINQQVKFFDMEGENLPYKTEDTGKSDKVIFENKKFNDYLIQIYQNLIQIKRGNSYLNFLITSDYSFRLADKMGKSVNTLPIEKFGFEGKERFASSRGYIWSRSIPLIKKTVFIGHGPDTFALYFPQNDYIGKLNGMYDAYINIDKPHNMFLQISINTGILSLISFLLILLFYMLNVMPILIKSNFEDLYSITSLGIFVAVIGYLICGLANDSVVSVAPVFWVLLGVGTGISYILNQQKSSNMQIKFEGKSVIK